MDERVLIRTAKNLNTFPAMKTWEHTYDLSRCHEPIGKLCYSEDLPYIKGFFLCWWISAAL